MGQHGRFVSKDRSIIYSRMFHKKGIRNKCAAMQLNTSSLEELTYHTVYDMSDSVYVWQRNEPERDVD